MLKIYSGWWNQQKTQEPSLRQHITNIRTEKKNLQNQALAKKREFDSSQGDIRRIVGREIEGIFSDIDGKDRRLTIIYIKNFQGKVQFTLEQMLKV